MNVYLDGGCTMKNPVTRDRLKSLVFGWGIVIQDGEEQTELFGSRSVNRDVRGLNHELIAFVEAALYLSSHGFQPEDVNFVTDDQLVVYGSQLGPWNGIGYAGFYNALVEALEALEVAKLYKPEALLTAMHFIRYSRFHWVKGHHKCCLNLRCDYLAKISMHRVVFGSKRMMDFDEWSKVGYTAWNKAEAVNEQVYQPFCATLGTLKEAA
jgi:ribonuclease HI